MTTYDFLSRNWPELMNLAWQHTVFVSIALAIAITTGVPLGVYLTFNRRLADTVLYLAAPSWANTSPMSCFGSFGSSRV